MMKNQMIFVRIAGLNDICYAAEIVREMAASAIVRGSGISRRTVECLAKKMTDGKAVIAVTGTGEWVGFSYFEVWDNNSFVSNSGLIVAPKFRKAGVASAIKERIFRMSRRLYPDARIFSITSGAAIMKMNSRLGFEPVSFAEITQEESFWEGCKSCVNYSILEDKKRCNCLCTAMLFDPSPRNTTGQVGIKQFQDFNTVTIDCISNSRLSLVPDAAGTHALCSALTDIKWFTTYVFPIERDLPNPVEMTVVSVNANIKQQNVDSQCSFTVEIRYNHNYTLNELLNTIKNHTRCKFKVREEDFNYSVTEELIDNTAVVSNNH